MPACEAAWAAFWAVAADRPVGFGEGRVPWSSVHRWAARYGITDIDEFDTLRARVETLDKEYLKLRWEQSSDGDS